MFEFHESITNHRCIWTLGIGDHVFQVIWLKGNESGRDQALRDQLSMFGQGSFDQLMDILGEVI